MIRLLHVKGVVRLVGGGFLAAALCLAGAAAAGAQPHLKDLSELPLWPNGPAGFIPPLLHPRDMAFETRELGDGVYALVSNRPPSDNVGFIVGERGVLVVDAHINGTMAQRIMDAVRAVTDKPILYLVNTNYHGDHTFGNSAFPASTVIIAQRHTAAAMRDFAHERRLMYIAVRGDESAIADVRPRLPDLVFDDYLRIELGGRTVELHHFGGGNTDGDTVVYEPESRVAFTGNLIVGRNSIPLMFDNGAATFLQTLSRLRGRLDIGTIVPGHLPLTDGSIVAKYLRYCSELIDAVQAGRRAGKSEEQIVTETPLDDRYLPQGDDPLSQRRRKVLRGFHRFNLQSTYRELAAG